MLFGYPLINRKSYRLNKYFLGAVHDLDEAAGTWITLTYIGDPGQSGEVHKSLRSPKLRKNDVHEARDYVEEVHKTGREDFHRLGEMKRLQRTLDLADDDLPCIAFLTHTGNQPTGILRILPSWFDTEIALDRFDASFRSWLSSNEVRRLATSRIGENEIRRRLAALVSVLSTEIDEEIGGLAEGGDRQPSKNRTLAAAVLGLDVGAMLVLYKNQEVGLTPTQFRLMSVLARSPGRLIPHERLMKRASTRVGEFEGSPCRWAKDHKLGLMRALRRLIGREGITKQEIDSLISARKGCLVLNLSADQVVIER